MEQIFADFQNSVVELADKLPQWSSEDLKRRKYSAMFSLCEEAGEISGLMSKYRCRKKKDIDYYNTAFSDLPEENKEEIKNKFIDEVGDLLWVLVCSEHSLTGVETILEQITTWFEDYNIYISSVKTHKIELVLMRLIGAISSLGSNYLYDNDEIKNVADQLKFVAEIFAMFCACINYEYNITLEEIVKHNMEKLGVRYDKDGKRTDGR